MLQAGVRKLYVINRYAFVCRLVCENDTLCSIVKDLKDDVRDLRHLNRVLKESMEHQKVRACCSKSSSVHVGLQTCSASCPEMDKCECSNDLCDNPHNSYPVSVNLKTTASACSCTSDACSCSGSKNALDKICRCVDDDREKLQCRLNEMAEVCNAKEKIAQKALCEAERMLSDVETKLQQCRVQSHNQIAKLSGKLAECEMTIRCKEKELDGCRLRGNFGRAGHAVRRLKLFLFKSNSIIFNGILVKQVH